MAARMATSVARSGVREANIGSVDLCLGSFVGAGHRRAVMSHMLGPAAAATRRTPAANATGRATPSGVDARRGRTRPDDVGGPAERRCHRSREASYPRPVAAPTLPAAPEPTDDAVTADIDRLLTDAVQEAARLLD